MAAGVRDHPAFEKNISPEKECASARRRYLEYRQLKPVRAPCKKNVLTRIFYSFMLKLWVIDSTNIV